MFTAIACLGVGLVPAALAALPRVASAQEPWLLEKYSVPVAELKGRAIGDPDVLAKPGALLVHGQRIVIIDNSADARVIIIDASTGRTVGRFGRKGSGPGEFTGATSLESDPDDQSAFWVHDITLRRMTKVLLASNYPTSGLPNFTTLNFKANIMEPRWTSSREIVGPGIFPAGRVSVFTRQGEFVRAFGALPSGDERVPMTVRQEAYRSYMSLSPDRSRMVLATRYADRIEFFRTSGEKFGEATRPFSFEPKFSVGAGKVGPVMQFGDDMRYGYTGLAATDQLIFALFSGRMRGGFNSQAPFANFVHVYDWTGRLLRVFRLDVSVVGLAVDSKASRIFALRHDPLPSVVVFDVQPITTR